MKLNTKILKGLSEAQTQSDKEVVHEKTKNNYSQ